MRVAIVRSDISSFYLDDVENTSQRDFSSQPGGQSRYFKKPTDAQFLATLNARAVLSALGNNGSTTYNTSANHTLRIRTSAAAAFTAIEVTAGVGTAKSLIATQLNAAFVAAGLPVVATYFSSGALSGQIQLDTVAPNSGPSAYLELDTAGNGSTLNVAIGSTWDVSPPVLSGLSVAALKAAVYPTSVTVDVSSATVAALSTFASMQAVPKAALLAAVADLVAPKLVETGLVLLSFAYGKLSKISKAAFQPGGARSGLPAGIAAAIVQDDGTSVFVL